MRIKIFDVKAFNVENSAGASGVCLNMYRRKISTGNYYYIKNRKKILTKIGIDSPII